MIVCRSIKLLFTHVPKTGGSAVTAALVPYIDKKMRRGVGERGWQPPLHEIGNMHAPWESVRDEAMSFFAQGFRLIAAHRSPYERVASLYHKKMELPGKDRTIEVFAEDADKANAWWLQQAVDVAGPDVCYWMRYTHLEEDLCYFLGKLGVTEIPPMVYTNVTENKRPAYEVLTPRAVEIIRERFADDIKMFGYEPPEEL
ncbi:sulfotransferase family 2 domain-containing protein [Patescibacteria group bacterium]|nr:sulfotransferase family 2 domain-containing protein [Patescibacteria group bacterium]